MPSINDDLRTEISRLEDELTHFHKEMEKIEKQTLLQAIKQRDYYSSLKEKAQQNIFIIRGLSKAICIVGERSDELERQTAVLKIIEREKRGASKCSLWVTDPRKLPKKRLDCKGLDLRCGGIITLDIPLKC